MGTQDALMKYDPATGEQQPYPSHAAQWREFHGATAWLVNPWTGAARKAADIGSDVFGLMVTPPGFGVPAMPAPAMPMPVRHKGPF